MKKKILIVSVILFIIIIVGGILFINYKGVWIMKGREPILMLIMKYKINNLEMLQ